MPKVTWSVDLMQLITIVIMLLGFASVAGQFRADMANFKELIAAIRVDQARLSAEVKEVQIRLERNQTIVEEHIEKRQRQ